MLAQRVVKRAREAEVHISISEGVAHQLLRVGHRQTFEHHGIGERENR